MYVCVEPQLQERVAEVERTLENVEGEISSGLRCEFEVDPSVLGLVIGTGGKNINRVRDETGARARALAGAV